MRNVSIKVEDLSKRYRLGVIGRQTLQDEIKYWWLKMRRRDPRDHMRVIGSSSAADEDRISSGKYLFALRDVSFSVREGEVLGVIGRNGSGKSTLLKVLSRITEPTYGCAEITGRVAALLEVGTGFHPELTGKENIYLNGTLLGMKKAEIDSKFNDIVSFSELETYLDTPVKRYSNGMAVRLAFAVAAHLEPEILLVDEVLAVGDARFQRNCLGKMGEVVKSGRTIIFVSHQMNAISSLCDRCLWLDRGRVVELGEPDTVISRYLSFQAWEGEWSRDTSHESYSNPHFEPTRMAVVDRSLQPLKRDIRANEEFGLLLEGISPDAQEGLNMGFHVFAANGESVFITKHTDSQEGSWPKIEQGVNRLVVWIPAHTLNEGYYRVEVVADLHGQQHFLLPGVKSPSVALNVRGGLSTSPRWINKRPGVLAPVLPFEKI